MASPPDVRSTPIFRLAVDHGLPSTPGSNASVDDETFLSFKNRYLEWAIGRDVAVESYLARTPNYFRAYLPYRSRAFHLASQVVWYLDELVIGDPIAVVLGLKDIDLGTQKQQTVASLQMLSLFRDSIEDGYVLLRSLRADPSPEGPSRAAVTIAEDPTVQEALRAAAYCGYELRVSPEGIPCGVYQISLEEGGIVGVHIKGPTSGKTFTTPLIKVGEFLKQVDASTLEKLTGRDPWAHMEGTFRHEVHRVL